MSDERSLQSALHATPTGPISRRGRDDLAATTPPKRDFSSQPACWARGKGSRARPSRAVRAARAARAASVASIASTASRGEGSWRTEGEQPEGLCKGQPASQPPSGLPVAQSANRPGWRMAGRRRLDGADRVR